MRGPWEPVIHARRKGEPSLAPVEPFLGPQSNSREQMEPLRKPKTAWELPRHIRKDGAKWLMVPTKIILNGVSVWPECQNLLTNFLNVFYVLTAAFFLTGQLFYIADRSVDLGSLAYAISIVVLSVETIVRRILCYYYRDRLVRALQELYFEFWSSDVAGVELHRELTRTSWYLLIYCLTFMGFAFIWALQAMTMTILYGKLPLSTKYPFEWRESPCYELLYVWQSFMTLELVFNICGIDLFFASLLLNCVAQFRLLRVYFRRKCEEELAKGSSQTYMDVLLLIMKRHNKLIRSCKEIEHIFTYFILVQYLAIIGAVCLSSFVATAVPNGLRTSLSYGLGHLFEIFIFCYMGETLILESSKLSDAIYECGWNLTFVDLQFQRAMQMVMVRSQKGVRMSAGGFGYLSLSGFMKIIQFSFSVYTLLNKMMEKQNRSQK